jgi:hypothetical protein
MTREFNNMSAKDKIILAAFTTGMELTALAFITSSISAQACLSAKPILSTEIHQGLCYIADMNPR